MATRQRSSFATELSTSSGRDYGAGLSACCARITFRWQDRLSIWAKHFLNQVIEKTEALLWHKVIHPVTFSLAYSGNLSAIGAAALALHRELDIL